jgi:antitoxin ParD1/3/4
VDSNYGNTSEYLRDLIRRDQHEQAARRLHDLIDDGLASGDGRVVTADVVTSLREQAFSADT